MSKWPADNARDASRPAQLTVRRLDATVVANVSYGSIAASTEGPRPARSGHGRQTAEVRSSSRIENGVSLKIIAALVSALLITPLAASADDAASNFPAEASACTPKVQARLRADVSKLAGRRRPEAARELVSTFLCGESPNAERFIAKASAKVVIDKVASPSGVEQRPSSDIMRSIREQLPHSKAWNPELRLEGQDLVVYYSIDQYCWNFFGLRFIEGMWRLVLVGGGCD